MSGGDPDWSERTKSAQSSICRSLRIGGTCARGGLTTSAVALASSHSRCAAISRSRKLTLIPLLEAQTEINLAGPTRVMRKGRIEPTLDRLSRLVATRRCAVILQGFDGEPDEPSAFFANRDSKEEAIPYPFMDRTFNPVDRGELLSALRAFKI